MEILLDIRNPNDFWNAIASGKAKERASKKLLFKMLPVLIKLVRAPLEAEIKRWKTEALLARQVFANDMRIVRFYECQKSYQDFVKTNPIDEGESCHTVFTKHSSDQTGDRQQSGESTRGNMYPTSGDQSVGSLA